jgi:hypothetical protein
MLTIADHKAAAEQALRDHALCPDSCLVRRQAQYVLTTLHSLEGALSKLTTDTRLYRHHPGVLK